ncbi:hypothetical protein B0H67DRAFT_60145 [Lasiosphaeris hirsuta]|uniref:DUF7603 domain-containing protein n=1 Tax=Lasiosphaeris hirsuta TaxID=260670 RepID=A0AA40BBA2_9PEZI|nr:hypothetical protein B0H67DRAFT_60145 [Lasiosphaeris hirsuta]
MYTMAALDPLRGHTPSDTTSASPQAAPRRPALPPPLGPLQTYDQTDAFPPLPNLPATYSLPSPRAGRSKSLAIKRKPLSSTASPLATRYSTRDYLEAISKYPRPEQRFSRSCSLDSPTLYEFPDHRSLVAAGLLKSPDSASSSETSQPSSPELQQPVQPLVQSTGTGESLVRNSAGSNPAAAQTTHGFLHSEDLSAETLSLTTQESSHDEVEAAPIDSPESGDKRATVISTTMSVFTRKSPPPYLTLGLVDTNVPVTTFAADQENSNLNKPLPKSPSSSNLDTFFGWAGSPTSTSVTDFSDRGYSPLPSPYSFHPVTIVNEIDAPSVSSKASTYSNAAEESPLHYSEEYTQTPSAGTSSASLAYVEEMEDELKAISAELASSIRREMDLEDLVERMQEQISNPQAPGKRTSDYFSDSGYSSAKFSEYDHAKEEISLIQRRAEQEKAQLRLELIGKLQDERSQRRTLSQQLHELSTKAAQVDTAQLNSEDASGRVQELENTCEDLRRKLCEERQVKSNFEDLLAALKGELRSASNERDNLRDEIVPQLRARVEGLEAAAAESAKLAYDTSKMQQELQLLRSENSELKESVTSAPSAPSAPPKSAGLSRSASVAGSSYKNRAQSLTRSNTLKQNEPREILAERLKDVEVQRDALHSALRSLLERQEFQNRENQKRIRQLEMERDRLLSASPKKAGYEKDVSMLREEISTLRRRAEEALEQKYQVEKGLGGLKMDLDRAEQEIASLQALLQENDILIPEMLARSSSISIQPTVPVTSDSLERAYKDLQVAYTEALERIKSLEASTGSDEKTQLAIQRLEQSVSVAISDRDSAYSEANSYRAQMDSLQDAEKRHFDVERDLADQLRESARRVEELAQQVRSQLATNATLRTRLADTVARGEVDRRMNTERIASMQSRLKKLEEQVIAAQTGAEERVARHEDELARLNEAHNIQLQRLRDASGGLRSPNSPRLFPPKSPLSPMFSTTRSGAAGRSPRMSSPLLTPYSDRPGFRQSSTSPVDGTTGSLTEQVETLKGRVAELEGALAAADNEMQEVVGRMNTAQIEVMTLQEEREAAVRETRRLQRTLEEERVRVFEQRFRTITTEVR